MAKFVMVGQFKMKHTANYYIYHKAKKILLLVIISLLFAQSITFLGVKMTILAQFLHDFLKYH